MKRILFILKNTNYGNYPGKASGLRCSAQFVSDMLNDLGFVSEVVIVTDNNDIDREVTRFAANVAIIEALWVVPEKFDILKKLHPTVEWVVRLHSELPFLANEGISIDWIRGYTERDVRVAFNSYRTYADFVSLGFYPFYLPNYYPKLTPAAKAVQQTPGLLNVGCFGAIRPLKNQFTQAVAAIDYAESKGLYLKFHMNIGRVEDHGASVLKSIKSLFAFGNRELIQHGWYDHDNFLFLLDQMDIALSVSFTETFSIVTADAVSRRIPIVTSPEVTWADPDVMATPTDAYTITQKMDLVLRKAKKYTDSNLLRLHNFSSSAAIWWQDELLGKPKSIEEPVKPWWRRLFS